MAENPIQERDRFIEALYAEMNFKLRYLAARRLSRPELAEEAVQNALVVLCEQAEKVMKHPNPQGWLMQTLINVIKAMNRKAEREAAMVSGSLEDMHALHHDDYHEVEFGDLLSPEDFRLIEMVAVQRYTIPEAAKEIGISIEAAKKRKQRATKRLRELLLGSEE